MAYNDYSRSLVLFKEKTIINLHPGTSVSFTKISFPGKIAGGVNEREDTHDLLMVIMGT